MHEPAFLTLIGWPEAMSRTEVAALLARVAGVDEATGRLWAAKQPPVVLARMDAEPAGRLVKALCGAGGEAIAPTMSQIEVAGPTRKIRDLRIGAGGLELDLWRGGGLVVAPGAIWLIVRASVSEARRGFAVPSAGDDLTEAIGFAISGYGYCGAYGLARAFEGGFAANVSIARPWTDSYQTPMASEKLDLHVAGEGVLQIDGDKFGFGVLGDARAMSDNRNLDLVCELLTSLAPRAIVDPYFSLWRPPAGHDRIRLPGMVVNNDDPAFAFYSRWIGLVYERLLA
jgi:hypothetical protein